MLCMLVLALFFAVPLRGGDARVISLDPQATEFLHTLGQQNSLVGVSDSCVLPEEAPLVPRVGSTELNMEKIAALKPTLILDLNGAHKRYELLFRQLSLNYLNIEMTRLEDIPSAAARLSGELGAFDRGAAFTDAWNREFSRLSAISVHPKPRVYIETWDAPLQSATEKSFIGQLVQLAGGDNIIRDTPISFPVVTDLQVIRANPEVILIAYPISDISQIGSRAGWGDIDAVRKRRVYRLDDASLLRPGPSALKNILHLSGLIINK